MIQIKYFYSVAKIFYKDVAFEFVEFSHYNPNFAKVIIT